MLVRTAERPPATDAVHFPWLRWRSVSLGLRDIGSSREDLCLSADESGGSDTVFPLGEPDLYLTFAAISTPQDALAFARQHGLLGEFERGRFATLGVIEPAGIWLTHAALVARVVQVWERLQLPPAARRASLRECIHWQAADYVVARFQGNITIPIAWQGENARWLKRWKPGDLEGPARLFIADEVTRRLYRRATVQILPRDFGDTLQQVLTPADLLAGIWTQVAQLVTGVRQARRCEACGQLFDVTGSRSHKRIHDSCSLRLRMARYRAKKKVEARSNGTKTRKR